jgi:hypothetical protein
MVGLFIYYLSIIQVNEWGKYLAVHSATWNADYDIRVDTKKKDKPVTLTYKARIAQHTGEVRIAVILSCCFLPSIF